MRHLRTFYLTFPDRLHRGCNFIFVSRHLHRCGIFRNYPALEIVNAHCFEIVYIVDLYITVRTVYYTASVGLGEHRGIKRCHPTVPVCQHDRLLGIDTCMIFHTVCCHALDIVTEYHGSKIEHIYSQIEQRSAAQRQSRISGLMFKRISEICRKRCGSSYDAGINDLPYGIRHWHIPYPHCLGKKQSF